MSAEKDKRPWGETEPETMTQPQEEFIAEKSVPSVDISQLECPHCGKPQNEWPGKGVEQNGKRYCSPECAASALT